MSRRIFRQGLTGIRPGRTLKEKTQNLRNKAAIFPDTGGSAITGSVSAQSFGDWQPGKWFNIVRDKIKSVLNPSARW